ncbi:Nitrate reductase-like protein NarX [compost metagenome]
MIALVVVIVSGLLATSANAVNHTGFDYRTTINPWLRGLMIFQPDPTLMQTVPMNFKIHILLTFVLYCAFPFTRLVHMLSMPLGYLKRSYVVYRRRDGAVYPNQEHKKERAM